MNNIYKGLIAVGVILLGLFLFVRYTTKQLNEKIATLESTLQQEREAAQKQIKLEQDTADYYKNQYTKFIKDGDYCYNHVVEDDVLKMIGE